MCDFFIAFDYVAHKWKYSEVYTDHPQKPTKRPSLFFRKRKDKSKSKGQSTNCDGKCFTLSLPLSIPNAKCKTIVMLLIYHSGFPLNAHLSVCLCISSQLGCGAVINLATYKDHASECKAKLSKVC